MTKFVCWMVVCPALLAAQPSAAAVAGFEKYCKGVETRLAERPGRVPGDAGIERFTPSSGTDLPGSLLHHWRGTAFVAGARAEDFERLLRDVGEYPRIFAPEVIQARVLSRAGDHLQISMRVRQRHVITVVMDADYDVVFGRPEPGRGYSYSRSTKITETGAKGVGHGFLWRLNTYWNYEERDGGLWLQLEAVSLSRSIPRGLEWAIRGYVASIPRESLAFTLRAGSQALRQERNTK